MLLEHLMNYVRQLADQFGIVDSQLKLWNIQFTGSLD